MEHGIRSGSSRRDARHSCRPTARSTGRGANYEQRVERARHRLHIRSLTPNHVGGIAVVSTRTLQELQEQWQPAWPQALAAWSRHLVLRAPQLCLNDKEAAREGLSDSFAMIRLVDQAVVDNLHDVNARGLGEFAPEILAHEIGHHVLAPANLTDHARALARIRRALPTLEAHAPMIANLFTDLLINDRLQRSAGLRLAEVFRKLATEQEKNITLWRVYVRT